MDGSAQLGMQLKCKEYRVRIEAPGIVRLSLCCFLHVSSMQKAFLPYPPGLLFSDFLFAHL